MSSNKRALRPRCQSCGGKGWICDTTYDRTGEDVPCEKCFRTGMTQNQIERYLASKGMQRKFQHPSKP